MELTGKVVIVTGASMGIGEAAARAIAAKGATVALAARSTDKLQALAAELPDSFVVTADMTDAEDIAKMIAAVKERYGRIDVLVNNAGQGIYGAIENVSPAEYERVFKLNVVGPLIAMQRVIPIMRAQGEGAIVNISSLVSKNYFPFLGAYASTKYALNAISLTARKELESDGIVVSVMHPGLTETDFGKNAVRSDAIAEGMQSRQRPNMPAADSPQEVADRIVYAIESGEAEVTVH